MGHQPTKLQLGYPAAYCIKAQGVLDASWSDYFGDLTITQILGVEQEPLTVLTGQVVDQLMLLGILNRLCNLGLPICSVEWMVDNASCLNKIWDEHDI